MKVYDQDGMAIELVEPPIGGGGEGKVYRIVGHGDRVAKLYATDAESHREKILAMVRVHSVVAAQDALGNVAWPMAALYSDAARTQFVGFGMRCIDAELSLGTIHEYPAPPEVKMTVRDKVDFLIELCDIVTALHGIGQLIGDFNDNNVVRLKSGRAALVDVDSFFVRVAGPTGLKSFRCEAFADDIVAPEITKEARRTGSYAACDSKVYTSEADYHALAVHVFRLLFNGVHPFACVDERLPNGSYPSPTKTITRVERGETPYFTTVKGVKGSPFAPELSAFPPYLVDLFRRAFVEGNRDPKRRPSATEWKAALERFRGDLVVCKKDKRHYHWKGAAQCPYCATDAGHAIVAGPSAPKASGAQASGGQAASGVASALPGNPFQGAVAGGVAAAVANGPGIGYWVATLALGAAVFAVVGVATPLLASIGSAFGLGYPVWLQLLFLLAALGGVIAYNVMCVSSQAKASNYALAGLSSAGGMTALSLGMLAVAVALSILAVVLVIWIIGAVLDAF